jgi:hypothetical protein
LKTKRDFQAAAAAAISDYPRAAELYRARDPSLLASLDAMAAMLAMASAEQDVAAAEPFTMARDATVLADASAKGVLPFGLPTEIEAEVANSAGASFALATGRRILDTQGRVWVVVAGVTVPASGSVSAVLRQQSERSFDHTVTFTQPFYQIEVPPPAEGQSIVRVRLLDADGNEYQYKPEYANVPVGALSFQLLSDSSRRLLIEFGAEGLVGRPAEAGETYTVIVTDTEGDVTLGAGSKFAFEYTASPADAAITMTLVEVTSRGRGALDVATLRTISRYPSIYDQSAVYLGNFDYLVRRNLSPFKFLSVWNEQVEETVRGPNIDNINTLFVSAIKDGVDGSVLFDQIVAIIKEADDSYKVNNFAFSINELPVEIIAYVNSVYDSEQVEQQIREQILASYGINSAWAKSGQNRILYRLVYSLLQRTVPALQGDRADIRVTITDPVVNIPPEQFRYVSESSLTVTVNQIA